MFPEENKLIQLTPASKYVFIATLAAFALVIGGYLIRGGISDEVFTLDSQAWQQFASFTGGLLAPIAGFGAAMMVALQLGFTGRVTQLEMFERQCARLDKEIQRHLQQPMKNKRYQAYLGMPVVEVIYAVSDAKEETPDELVDALNSLLQTIAMLLEIVARNRLLIKRLEKSLGDYPWIEYSERAYWISRYSAVLGRLCRAIGYEKVASKLTERQIEVCAEISPEFKKAQ